MSRLQWLTFRVLVPATLLVGLCAAPARAQTAAAATTTTAARAGTDDDDSVLDPVEPEFRLVALPTTARLPRWKSNFALTHRFNGNLKQNTFGTNLGNLFGLDDGATVGLEYRLAVARHLEAIAYRVSNNRTIQLSAKYDAVHQRAHTPISVSVVASDEGTNNFQVQFAPALGLSVSHEIGAVAALYAVPMWVHNSAALTGVTVNTSYVGLGTRLRVRPTVYVTAEVTPRMYGYSPGSNQFAIALEKRAGGHMFQLNLSNSSGTTAGQLARGGAPHSLSLGFNLSRKFY